MKSIHIPWIIDISYQKSNAFIKRFNSGENIYLDHLIREPSNRKKKLPCVVLLIKRDNKEYFLPDDKTMIYPHDRILFSGDPESKIKINHILTSEQTLHYTCTGNRLPSGYFWRWITRTPS